MASTQASTASWPPRPCVCRASSSYDRVPVSCAAASSRRMESSAAASVTSTSSAARPRPHVLKQKGKPAQGEAMLRAVGAAQGPGQAASTQQGGQLIPAGSASVQPARASLAAPLPARAPERQHPPSNQHPATSSQHPPSTPQPSTAATRFRMGSRSQSKLLLASLSTGSRGSLCRGSSPCRPTLPGCSGRAPPGNGRKGVTTSRDRTQAAGRDKRRQHSGGRSALRLLLQCRAWRARTLNDIAS